MIKSVIIFKPNQIAVFDIGAKLIRDGIDTDIIVRKITYRFGSTKVYLSNGEITEFKGLPVNLIHG